VGAYTRNIEIGAHQCNLFPRLKVRRQNETGRCLTLVPQVPWLTFDQCSATRPLLMNHFHLDSVAHDPAWWMGQKYMPTSDVCDALLQRSINIVILWKYVYVAEEMPCTIMIGVPALTSISITYGPRRCGHGGDMSIIANVDLGILTRFRHGFIREKEIPREPAPTASVEALRVTLSALSKCSKKFEK